MAGIPAFGPKQPPPGNGARSKVQIVGFVGSVSMICPCGQALMVPVIPGQYARVECGTCGKINRIESIQYHEPQLPNPDSDGKIDPSKIRPPQLTIHVHADMPIIARPRVVV